jgi:maltooligosyltrehalose trehalohydrolase
VKRHHVLPFGAEVLATGGTRFRLWAPDAKTVSVGIETRTGTANVPLERYDGGWYEALAPDVAPGALYQYRIDNELDVPDPASRFNPRGVHGPSEVLDPATFDWKPLQWRGRPWHEAVLYELHVGTFTPQGTFAAVIPRLADLAQLGVNCLEVLPVATFSGNRGWGYDGVLPFAPHPAYGRPEDLKKLVQAAHEHGISVVLDVVYNHFGPDGNFLHRYASDFFTERHQTPWGAAINFEGVPGARVREFFIQNALYWLDEYQFDGLRLDAIHAIKDDSRPDFVDELAQTLASGPARERHVHLILENNSNEARRLRTDDSSSLSRAQWNDDFHHALHVLATDESDGYYVDYVDAVRMTGRILAEGFAYQGEPSVFADNEPRGEVSRELPPTAFISFLQNHDQIGNRAMGERLAHLAEPQRLRSAMAILLLSPQPPLLFMGE